MKIADQDKEDVIYICGNDTISRGGNSKVLYDSLMNNNSVNLILVDLSKDPIKKIGQVIKECKSRKKKGDDRSIKMAIDMHGVQHNGYHVVSVERNADILTADLYLNISKGLGGSKADIVQSSCQPKNISKYVHLLPPKSTVITTGDSKKSTLASEWNCLAKGNKFLLSSEEKFRELLEHNMGYTLPRRQVSGTETTSLRHFIEHYQKMDDTALSTLINDQKIEPKEKALSFLRTKQLYNSLSLAYHKDLEAQKEGDSQKFDNVQKVLKEKESIFEWHNYKGHLDELKESIKLDTADTKDTKIKKKLLELGNQADKLYKEINNKGREHTKKLEAISYLLREDQDNHDRSLPGNILYDEAKLYTSVRNTIVSSLGPEEKKKSIANMIDVFVKKSLAERNQKISECPELSDLKKQQLQNIFKKKLDPLYKTYKEKMLKTVDELGTKIQTTDKAFKIVGEGFAQVMNVQHKIDNYVERKHDNLAPHILKDNVDYRDIYQTAFRTGIDCQKLININYKRDTGSNACKILLNSPEYKAVQEQEKNNPKKISNDTIRSVQDGLEHSRDELIRKMLLQKESQMVPKYTRTEPAAKLIKENEDQAAKLQGQIQQPLSREGFNKNKYRKEVLDLFTRGIPEDLQKVLGKEITSQMNKIIEKTNANVKGTKREESKKKQKFLNKGIGKIGRLLKEIHSMVKKKTFAKKVSPFKKALKYAFTSRFKRALKYASTFRFKKLKSMLSAEEFIKSDKNAQRIRLSPSFFKLRQAIKKTQENIKGTKTTQTKNIKDNDRGGKKLTPQQKENQSLNTKLPMSVIQEKASDIVKHLDIEKHIEKRSKKIPQYNYKGLKSLKALKPPSQLQK